MRQTALHAKRAFFNKIPEIIQGKFFRKFMFSRDDFDPYLCKFPAVYMFLTSHGDILYIGKANDVSSRVSSHLNYETECNIFMDYTSYIVIIKGAGISEEEFLIKTLNPIFNCDKLTTNLGLIRKEVISKNPAFKDQIVRALIIKNRRDSGDKKTVLHKYFSCKDVEEVLTLMSLYTDEVTTND